MANLAELGIESLISSWSTVVAPSNLAYIRPDVQLTSKAVISKQIAHVFVEFVADSARLLADL